ncbi:MAG: hypothetical protein BroJett021_51390 [Chloroflexota bacterium]|nr:type II toxin-antitoxin system HicB family antitoxin [Caldilinea sp.]GIK76151.1 MAG: hypothetical protein BroJett021_51390 [Chloroflexota bacterium]
MMNIDQLFAKGSAPPGAVLLSGAIPVGALISLSPTSMACVKEARFRSSIFEDACREDGVESRKAYSGKFNLRVS